jgi:hypothetical protein
VGKIRELGTEVSEAIIDNAVVMPVLNQINLNNANFSSISGGTFVKADVKSTSTPSMSI